MIFYIDLQTGQVGASPGLITTNDVGLTRRDFKYISVVFTRGTSKTVYNISQLQVGIKQPANLAGDFLTTAFFTDGGAITSSGTTYNTYNASLNLNTPAIESAFTGEPQSISALMEFQWVLSENRVNSSLPVSVKLYNDVIRGNEGIPATLPLFYTSETSDFLATQAEAEAGLDNTKWMSPLRVAQAIEELGGGGGGGGVTSYNDLTDVPSTFPPEAHTHPLSALTQSSATNGQVATWNGTAWVPQTPSGGGGGVTSYNDLTDVPSTFPPEEHTHGNITNAGAIGTTSGVPIVTGTSGVLQAGSFGTTAGTFAQGNHTHTFGTTAGTFCQGNDSRLADARTPTAHIHDAADINSGTFPINRIPTGTTSSTVSLGNHTHGNLTSAGAIGTTANLPIITGASGYLQAGSFGTTAGTFAQGNHVHGNLTSAGAIGTTASLPVITGASGVLQAGSFGTTAGTFCQGNDSRLLNISGGITAIAVVTALPATPNATTLYIVTG
jgi:hypothetical protein